MTKFEKIALLEEMMELDAGSLEEDNVLDEIDEWNSLAKLSLIAIMDEEFNKQISASKIREFKTIKDILEVMN